jgi:gentisate 1,2-dioxygenase
MDTNYGVTLADPALPAEVFEEMESLNRKAAPLHIWLRTRANQPQKKPWHWGSEESAQTPPPESTSIRTPPPVFKPTPHIWKWKEIEPFLYKIAEIAPLEFTERQQFLLVNPGCGGALQVTNTIRVAVSIYKPGDQAVTHRHTPNASRTILSKAGGYTTVEGEICRAGRGDLILTPNGTWHGHGNDDDSPVIWMDVLDWPLMERLDCIWLEEEDEGKVANSPAPSQNWSGRHYGSGGMLPLRPDHRRGIGVGNSPMFHFRGEDIRLTLEGMAQEESDPFDGIAIEFTNPVDGSPPFTTLAYGAHLLKPNEETLASRSSCSSLFCCISGSGTTEVAGKTLDWEENDIFVIPNHLWFQHRNKSNSKPAVLYGISDRPLLENIGHYRRQGKTSVGSVIELN